MGKPKFKVAQYRRIPEPDIEVAGPITRYNLTRLYAWALRKPYSRDLDSLATIALTIGANAEIGDYVYRSMTGELGVISPERLAEKYVPIETVETIP